MVTIKEEKSEFTELDVIRAKLKELEDRIKNLEGDKNGNK